jgi:hypothetical protein
VFEQLDLVSHGLQWVQPDIAMAHPQLDGPTAVLTRSIDETAASLGTDADRYRKLVERFAGKWSQLSSDALSTLAGHVLRHPLLLAQFGLPGILPAAWSSCSAINRCATCCRTINEGNASFNQSHLVNSYGAFGSVTKLRHEVIIEGQGGFDNDPQMLTLMAGNPFANEAPHIIRARFFRYEFTTWKERRETKAYWKRSLVTDSCRRYANLGAANNAAHLRAPIPIHVAA